VNHRLRDHRYTGLREIELLPHLTPPDILTTTRTWKDLCRFLRDKVAWLTPGVCVCTGDYSFVACLQLVLVIGSNACSRQPSLFVHARSGTATAAATATCDFLLRLLVTCGQPEHRFLGSTSVCSRSSSLFPREPKLPSSSHLGGSAP
jgi:hypothetical protein